MNDTELQQLRETIEAARAKAVTAAKRGFMVEIDPAAFRTLLSVTEVNVAVPAGSGQVPRDNTSGPR